MSEPKAHKRVNDILLGPLERPALQWLAAHAPAWMTPDMLTGIGILGSLTIFVAYVLTGVDKNFLWLANLGLLINWYGDSLDGTVARYRKIERPKFGFFIDHTTDAFSQFFVVIGLGLSPYVRFDVAAMALIGYLLVSVYVYVDTYVTGLFKISYGKLGPTEVRAIIVIANTLVYFLGNPSFNFSFGDFSVFDLFVLLLAAVLFFTFTISTLTRARELAREGE
ncbi:MAG: CDP-alcohol phosphatidyltransferase family protein [Candidatus Promineifilaceae bacterium]